MIVEGNRVLLKLFTDNNEYSIIAHPSKDDKGYLGCVSSCRKPRAGETWTRGSDLPDGPYNDKTALNILKSIIGYELVKIHQPVARLEDMN